MCLMTGKVLSLNVKINRKKNKFVSEMFLEKHHNSALTSQLKYLYFEGF